MIFSYSTLTVPSAQEAAEILAQKADWGRLYDFSVLAENKVPVAAAVYYEDAAVVREYSLETAKAIKVG